MKIRLNKSGIAAKNYSFRVLIFILFPAFVLLADFQSAYAQLEQTETEEVDPRGALWRSLLVPGWGHHYVDKQNWNRGKYHLAADVILIASYFGVNARANSLEDDLEILARSKANTEITGKGRSFELAVSNFNSQAEYNDFQRRTRNVDQLFEGDEFFWEWESQADRLDFEDTREKIDRNENQLPVLISLMVANRVISGVSSFVRARKKNESLPQLSFSYLSPGGTRGVTAHLRFNF